MIDFTIKKISDYHYNLTFIKESGKPDNTMYAIPIDVVKNKIAHEETCTRFGDKDVSLSEYLKEYNKTYNEVCELLKKTLS